MEPISGPISLRHVESLIVLATSPMPLLSSQAEKQIIPSKFGTNATFRFERSG